MNNQFIKIHPYISKIKMTKDNEPSKINKNNKLSLKIFKINDFSVNFVKKEINKLNSNLKNIFKKIDLNKEPTKILHLTNLEKNGIYLNNINKSSNKIRNLNGSSSDTRITLNNFFYLKKQKKFFQTNYYKKQSNSYNFELPTSRLINKMKKIVDDSINPVNMTLNCEKNNNSIVANKNKKYIIKNNFRLYMMKSILISETKKHYMRNKFKNINRYFNDWLNYKNNNKANNEKSYLTIENLYNYINDKINFKINKVEIFKIFKFSNLNEGLSLKNFNNFFFDENFFILPKVENDFLSNSSIRKKEEYCKYLLMLDLLKEKKYLLYEKVFNNRKFFNNSFIDIDNKSNVEYNFDEFHKLIIDLYPDEKILCVSNLGILFNKYINIKTKKINMKKFIYFLFDNKSKLSSQKKLNYFTMNNSPRYNFSNFLKNWKNTEKLNNSKYNNPIYYKDYSINRSNSSEKSKDFINKSIVIVSKVNKDNRLKINNSIKHKIDFYKNKSMDCISPIIKNKIDFIDNKKVKSLEKLEKNSTINSSNIMDKKDYKKIEFNNKNIKPVKIQKNEIKKEFKEKNKNQNNYKFFEVKKKVDNCDFDKINKKYSKNYYEVDNKIYKFHKIKENLKLKNKNSDILDLL